MSEISFTGLSTKLDTEAIITKLAEIETAQIPRLQTQQSAYNTQVSTIADLTSKLSALSTAVSGLDTASEFHATTASSSNTSAFTATSSGAAAAGSYSIAVNKLATNEHDYSKTFSTSSLGVGDTGVVRIAVGATNADVSYTAGQNLQTVADSINSKNLGVTASVLFDGTNYRIAVSGESGAAKAITFTQMSGTALDFAETQAAQDSEIVIDGIITVKRSTNTVSDAITGVTLQLAAEDETSTLSISRDTTTEKANINKIVDAYNKVATVLSNQLTYSGDGKNPDDPGKLLGDSTLRSLQAQMRTLMSTKFNGLVAVDLGLSLKTNGQMKFDSTVYDKATLTAPDQMVSLLAGTDGFAAKIVSIVDSYTKDGATETTDGFLVTKSTSLGKQIEQVQSRIDTINDNATKLSDRMRKIFSALEVTTANINAQGQQLLAVLGGA